MKHRWCVVLVGSVALAASVLVFGCKGFDEGFDPSPSVQRGEEVSGKAAPKVEGPRISERAVPTSAPLVGEDGTWPDGYPRRQADKVALLNLLRLRRFDELDRYFAFYQDAYERDYRHEYWPDGAVSAFYTPDPVLEPLLDAWVAHSPQSFAAYASRGNYRHKLGWHYRGNAYAHKTSSSQFRSMEEYFAAARTDLEKAIELRPKLLAAYMRLMGISGAGGPEKEEERLLQRALELCPLCYLPRAVRLNYLTPRWGGTYERMAAFVAESKSLWTRNPRLRWLAGYADADRCAVARQDDQLVMAHVFCDQALRAGDEPDTIYEKARTLLKEDHDAQALALLDRALQVEPHDRATLELRLGARIALAMWPSAASDALNARHLSPTDEDVTRRVTLLVGKLRLEADLLRSANKSDEAAQLLSLALQLAPDDRDLLHRAGATVAADELSAESIDARLAAAPDDFDLRIRLDAALLARNRHAEVVAMWDKFVVTHASDPRAFSERAGTKWHMQRYEDAITDMQQACDLGMAKACIDVAKMKARVGR